MIRVRFAPSPTGLPHVGNIRTAIFNWLLAKNLSGKFILRIEDTDQKRYDPNSLTAIMRALRWLGIDYDEGPGKGGEYGPYLQSQRLEIYHAHARQLISDGRAYYCDCSADRLESVRKGNPANPMYDRHCRKHNIQSDPTDPKTVVRFKMPLSDETCFHDILRGRICFDSSTLDDIVLVKSDGFPTYNYAVVIDDHLMNISHVLRGDEFIPSACKHVLIYSAFGWQPPAMIHLPIILGPDRTKLSKRHGATEIGAFEKMGVLPDAMLNFLVLLGWSPKKDLEILPREEIVRCFNLDNITVSPAVFDIKKLLWMNGEYIRMMPASKLTELLSPLYSQWGWPKKEATYLDRVSLSMQKRLKTLVDMRDTASFFFEDPKSYEAKGIKKNLDQNIAPHIEEVSRRLSLLTEWDDPSIENIIRGYSIELGINVAEIIHPLRLAVSGLCGGPGLFEIISIIGKDTTSRRILRVLEFIKEQK